jgi:hypothetical protein
LGDGEGAYWVRLLQARDSGLPLRVEARLEDSGRVVVETENAARLELDLAGPIFGARAPEVSMNGRSASPESSAGGRVVYAA